MAKLINTNGLKKFATELWKKIKLNTVTGVNGEKGDIALVEGDGISIQSEGGVITISKDGTITGVASINGVAGEVAITKEGKLEITTEGDNIKISSSAIELDVRANAQSISEVNKKVELLNTAEHHYLVNSYAEMIALESKSEEDGDVLKHAEIIHVLVDDDIKKKGTYIYNAEGESEEAKFIKIASLEAVTGVGEHTHEIADIEGLEEALAQAGKEYNLRLDEDGLKLVDSLGHVASTIELVTDEQILEIIQEVFQG